MSYTLKAAKDAVVEESLDVWNGVRGQRCTLGFIFAIICVLIVIVGNVILLIAINFWLSIFPTGNLAHNSSQIAVQVVSCIFMVLFFSAVAVVFVAVYGGVPMWRVLTDTNRIGHPLYRFFLLFASGASNAISGVLAVYSMTHTPEFIQAVLLCCIPFSAQAWTVIFIPEERDRDYLSLFFIASFIFFVAGILLSSMSPFLDTSEGAKPTWDWTLIYLASSVLFGLWCVVQRLYLDAIMVREGCERDEEDDKRIGGIMGQIQKRKEKQLKEEYQQRKEASSARTLRRRNDTDVVTGAEGEEVAVPIPREQQGTPSDPNADSSNFTPTTKIPRPSSGNCPYTETTEVHVGGHDDDDLDELDDDIASQHALLLAERRSWGRQSVNDNAAKLVLLVGGIFFQLTVSFVLFPVDAIPWFGTSKNASEAWNGFASSVEFIFESWYNVRYGLLYTLGFIMSFVGCTFLNEHSPTLASVVLQLAGPITSLVIIIVPQWNVYKDNGNVGHKVGGVILLFVAAFLYHVWEQRSMRQMVRRAHEKEQERLDREAAEEEEAVAADRQALVDANEEAEERAGEPIDDHCEEGAERSSPTDAAPMSAKDEREA